MVKQQTANADTYPTLLDSLEVCATRNDARQAYIGQSYGIDTEGKVTWQEFPVDHIQSLTELVQESDSRLGVETGLLNVIRACTMHGISVPIRFERLATLVFAYDGLSRAKSPKQMTLTAGKDNVGIVTVDTPSRRRSYNNVVFAPHTEGQKPLELISGRTKNKLPRTVVTFGAERIIRSMREVTRIDERWQKGEPL